MAVEVQGGALLPEEVLLGEARLDAAAAEALGGAAHSEEGALPEELLLEEVPIWPGEAEVAAAFVEAREGVHHEGVLPGEALQGEAPSPGAAGAVAAHGTVPGEVARPRAPPPQQARTHLLSIMQLGRLGRLGAVAHVSESELLIIAPCLGRGMPVIALRELDLESHAL